MDQAQAYTASINWLDYGDARDKIERDSVEQIPEVGLYIVNRVLRKLLLSYFAA